MDSEHRKYLARETLASAVINALLSAAVCWLVFGRGGAGSVDEAKVLAMDFLPQAFVLSVMSVLVPGLVTRRRLKLGLVAPWQGPSPALPRNLVLRAVVIALAATVLGGGAALLVTLAVWQGPLSIGAVYGIKVLFGVLLSIPVTRIGLRAALAARIG